MRYDAAPVVGPATPGRLETCLGGASGRCPTHKRRPDLGRLLRDRPCAGAHTVPAATNGSDRFHGGEQFVTRRAVELLPFEVVVDVADADHDP